MTLIDTHTHLYAKEFDDDRKALIADAIQDGVSAFYLPNIDSRSIAPMLSLEESYPDHCFAMMGLHPCSVKETYLEELALVKEWLDKRKFIAVGEIGIDLYWDKSFKKEQQLAFRQQIQWAKEYGLPYDIHCRDAFDEVMEIVSEFQHDNIKAVFHCFSGTIAQAEQILSMGNFKLGIGGVVTFKNSGIDKVVEAIGLKHLVLETDAPYLAPAPYRGKRNNPAYLTLIAQKIADLKMISIEEVAQVTTNNTDFIFGKQK
jgi:TatD DNase family protein